MFFFRSVVFLVEKEDIDVLFSKYLYREKIIDHWSVAKNSLTAQDQCSSKLQKKVSILLNFFQVKMSRPPNGDWGVYTELPRRVTAFLSSSISRLTAHR